MKNGLRSQILLLQVVSVALACAPGVKLYAADVAGPANSSRTLWQQKDTETMDLYWGPGAKDRAPKPDFVFIKEELDGTNPKFEVSDANGVKWKVKLGAETRPETVSTRLVWAAGYMANEDYFLTSMKVSGMPEHVHRGRKWISREGVMSNARLKRGDKEEGVRESTWRWKKNPFLNTREENGLRTLMALLNNWDVKDVNNAVLQRRDGTEAYIVGDLGATFGTSSYALSHEKAKGNLNSYTSSKFMSKIHKNIVDLASPGYPPFYLIFAPKPFFMRMGMRATGKHIPRADARWLGELMARLSQKQLEDAFRAASYSDQDIAAFTAILRQRIAALNEL